MPRKIGLFFKIVLPYRRTWYGALKDLGGYYYKTRTGKLLWVFPITKLPDVIAVIGESVEINEEEAKIVLDYCPPLREKMKLEKVKGEGYVEIHELADVFRIYTVVGKEEQVYEIPKENVLVAWKVMLTHSKGEKVPSRKVAEEICRELGLWSFFRGQRFNWEEFFGSRREYYHYFYLPIKVLEQKGLIMHHKRGFVERISDRGLFEKPKGEKK